MIQNTEEKWMEVYRVQTAAIERLEQQHAELKAHIKQAIWHIADKQPKVAEALLREAMVKAGVK